MKTILLKSKRSLLLRHIFFVLCLITIIYPTQLYAQDVKEEWTSRYGSHAASTIGTVHVAVDDAGNSFVTGALQQTEGSIERIITVKYSPVGEELWVASYSSPFQANPTGIVVDKNGDAYVVGSDDATTTSRGSALILKYNGEDGTQLWQNRHNPFPASRGNHILLDEQGDVFVIGSTSLSFNIVFLSKLNSSDGSQVWNRMLTRTGTTEDYANNLLRFSDFEIDQAGDVYVTGLFRQSATLQDIITLKYRGTDGETLWVQNFDSSKFSAVSGLAVDDAGGVFITGTIEGDSEDFLIKYLAENGEKLWTKLIPETDIPAVAIHTITVDNAGGIYLGGAGSTMSSISKYSTETGDRTWQATVAGTLTHLAADRAGAVYAAGNTSDQEYYLLKFDAVTGQQLWQQTSSETIAAEELTDIKVSAIVTNGNSHLYVTSSVSMPSLQGRKYMLVQYNTTTGKQEWTQQFKLLNNDDINIDLAVDAEGNSYVTGLSGDVSWNMRDGIKREIVVIKYSPEGKELWVSHFSFDDSFIARAVKKIVVDNAGGVYVLGSHRGYLLTIKYSEADGKMIWQSYHDTGNLRGWVAADMALDDAGGVYVTGSDPGSSSSSVTIKYNALNGDEEWVSTVERGGTTTAIEVMDGSVYVAGTRYNTDFDIVLLKYNAANGVQQQVNIFNSGNSDFALSMTTDSKDGIYVIGESQVGFTDLVSVLVKFNAATGVTEWSSTIEDRIRAGNVVADNSGSLFVSAYRDENTVLMKFDQLGNQIWLKEEATGISILPRQSVQVDDAGVYVARTVSDGIETSKYHTSDGTLQWKILKEANIIYNYGPLPQINLALDLNSNVIVSGYDKNDAFGDVDFLTIKYSQQDQGNLLCFDPLPVQLSLPPHAVRVGEQVLTTADFGDYVPGEAHNIRWEWDDQGQPTIAYFARGDSHVTGEHTYSKAGIYKVGLDFSESCLTATDETYKEWLVIYDPSAGSVTGDGQLLSLQTSLPWMNQQLNAPFSFNVSYDNTTDTSPQGQTQLNLREQGVFKSNAIEWLVVRGDQALWQGTGTLNGQGNYGFTASVWDGRGTGANDAGDEIRFRIWDKNAGNALVYDNFETAGDIYDMTNPTSRIASGQIIIHPFQVASATATQQAELYNYPNTFSDKTTISFTAEKAGGYSLEVYDMRGKLVKQLWAGQAIEGQNYRFELDGTRLPKGIYVARLVSSSGSQSIKMLLER